MREHDNGERVGIVSLSRWCEYGVFHGAVKAGRRVGLGHRLLLPVRLEGGHLEAEGGHGGVACGQLEARRGRQAAVLGYSRAPGGRLVERLV